MAELNRAYAMVRDPRAAGQLRPQPARASIVRLRGRRQRPRIGVAAAAAVRQRRARKLEFGRYTGWTLRDLARQDPDYLRWLSRHSSGLRYRTEIYQILGTHGRLRRLTALAAR